MLMDDWGLLALVPEMVGKSGLGTARDTKAKGHADTEMVLLGQVGEDDRVGSDLADEAADLGRRVDPGVIDAWRNLAGVCGRWYPVVLLLHSFSCGCTYGGKC